MNRKASNINEWLKAQLSEVGGSYYGRSRTGSSGLISLSLSGSSWELLLVAQRGRS